MNLLSSEWSLTPSIRAPFCATLLMLGHAAHATNIGDFDPTFAADGSGYLNFSVPGTSGQQATSVLSMPDGRVVLVGTISALGGGSNGLSTQGIIGVARLLPSGQLDPTFGDSVNSPGQRVVFVPSGDGFTVESAALTPDGRIVIAGIDRNTSGFVSGAPQASLVRLTATGSLDATFGSSGQVLVGESSQFNTVLVGDGSNLAVNEMIAGGSQLDPDRGHESQFLVRFNADGSIETGYGNAAFATGGNYWIGGVQCPDSASDSVIVALAFNPQYFVGVGSSYLYAAGNCSSASVTSESTVIAFDAATVADTTFGAGGLGYFTFGSTIASEPSYTTSMQTHVSPTGDMTITVAGYVAESSVSGETHYGVAQILKNGQFNTVFGNNGAITYDLGACCTGDPQDMSKAIGVLVDHEGRIIVGIHRSVADGSEPSFALAQLTIVGRPDIGFAPGSATPGTRTYLLNEFGGAENDSYTVPTSIAFTEGEKVLIAGYIDDGSGNDYFAVARIYNDFIFADTFEGTPVPPPE